MKILIVEDEPLLSESIAALLHEHGYETDAAYDGELGLDTPTCTIKLTTADGEYNVELRAYSTMDSKRYLSTGDSNVYLSSVDPFDTYEVTLEDKHYLRINDSQIIYSLSASIMTMKYPSTTLKQLSPHCRQTVLRMKKPQARRR